MLAPGTASAHGITWIGSGGEPALAGASHEIASDDCRTWIEDRRGSHRCLRRGWFAVREQRGTLVGPVCATHLQLLIRQGGPVVP